MMRRFFPACLAWALADVFPPATAELAFDPAAVDVPFANVPEFPSHRRLQSSVDDVGYAVAVGAGGSVIMVGGTYGGLEGEQHYGNSDAFIVSLLPHNGSTVWVRQFGSPADDIATGVASVGDAIFVVGRTDGSIFGAHGGGSDAFTAKYDSSGVLAWVHQLSSPGNDEASAVSVGNEGSVFVVGRTDSVLGGQESFGGVDAFVARYDSNGTLDWIRHLGGPGDDSAEGVVNTSDGGAIIVGRYAGNSNSHFGGDDAFVARYSVTGEQSWFKTIATSMTDMANGVAVGVDGEIYVAGATDGSLADQENMGQLDAFICRLTDAGELVWARHLWTNGYDVANAVAVGDDGAVVIAGYTGGTLGTAPNAGGSDTFIAKYRQNGELLWTQQLGTGDHDDAAGVAIGDSVYMIGWTEGASFVSPSALARRASASGGSDAVIASLGRETGQVEWVRQLGAVVTESRDLLDGDPTNIGSSAAVARAVRPASFSLAAMLAATLPTMISRMPSGL